MTCRIKKTVFLIVAIIVAVAISLQPPLMGLTQSAMKCIGIVAGMICLCIGDVVPLSVSCLAMLAAFLITDTASFSISVSGMTSAIVWFMLGAMGLGYALNKTGLIQRVSCWIMLAFPSSLRGQIFGMLGTGLAINPVIPSVTAKLYTCMPVTRGVADTLGYKNKSKQMHAVWCAMFTGINAFSCAFLNGNLKCVYIREMLESSEQSRFNIPFWTLASAVWIVFTFAGMMVGINLIFNRKSEYNEADKISTAKYFEEQLKSMGPMDSKAIYTLIILIISIILWAAEGKTGISSQAVAIGALVLLLLLDVINAEDMRHGIDWNTLLLVGILVSLGSVFEELGVNDYAESIIGPIFMRFSGNEYILLTVIVIGCYIIRMLISTQLAVLLIVTSVLFPICDAIGISRWVIGFAAVTSTSTWNVLYQSSNAVQGLDAFGDNGQCLEFRELAKSSICFMIVNLAAILASVPFWKYLRLIK